MGANTALLKRNVARIWRQIRLTAFEMQQLFDADLDCSGAAAVLVRMQTELRQNLEQMETANEHERMAG